jgi:hypothetical protein
LIAHVFLEKADQDHYGSLLTGSHAWRSLKNDKYLMTISDAFGVLCNHKLDHHGKSEKSENKTYGDIGNIKENEPAILSLTQLEGTCRSCERHRHKSPDCRFSNEIPKENGRYTRPKKYLYSKQGHSQSRQQHREQLYQNLHHGIQQNMTSLTWDRHGLMGIHSQTL